MNRREFLDTAVAAAALAAAGQLPALAQEGRGRTRRKVKPTYKGPRNIFTEPPAIEPLTGYLETFGPTTRGDMRSPGFVAQYDIIRWASIHPRTGKARNTTVGNLSVNRKPSAPGAIYRIVERRLGQVANEWRAALKCSGDLDELDSWNFTSLMQNRKSRDAMGGLTFKETGTRTGQRFEQRSSLATLEKNLTGRLIAQWSLLHMLAKGRRGDEQFSFDMLADCSVLKPDQTLRYGGKVKIPTTGGKVELDCYAQTGWGILPTHYLVDSAGRVQLITQADTNWALQKVGNV